MANYNEYFPLEGQLEGTVFENDPNDSGGCTKWGLTLVDLQDYYDDKTKTCNDVKNMDANEANLVLKKLYWDYFLADNITNNSLGKYIVDGGLNQGKVLIAKYVQEIVGVEDDGIFGQHSLAAVNAYDPESLFNQLKQKRIDRYDRIVANNPSQKVYYKGWMNRVNAIPFVK